MRNPLKQRKNEFELEVLEPRVMLSGDALLTAAFAEAGTHVHRAATVSHEAGNATQTQLSEQLANHAAPAASDIFEGMSGTAIQSAEPVAATAKSTDTVRTNVAVKTGALPAVSSKIIAPISRISPSAVAEPGSAMAGQLTATLKAANGPPGSVANLQVLGNQDIASSLPINKVKQNVSSASTSSAAPQSGSSAANLFQTIVNDISAIASGNGTASISLPSASLGGVLTFQSVQVALTISGNSVTAVSIQTGTASLNLGGGVTSSIQSATGSYNVGSQTFSLTLNTVAIAFSSFANVTAGSASVTYVGGNSTNVTLSNNTTKPVSLLEIGISNASIFAGVNGPASQSGAVGVELDNASLGLALMSASDGTLYYGLQTTVGTLRAVGLPDGFTMSATNLGMQINSSTDGSNVVNFDQSFVRGTGLAIAVGSTSINLDYQQQFFEASGTIDIAFNGFVDIQGSMAIQYVGSQSVTVTGSSTPVTVSTLTIAASGVTIFAGVNGPASNSGAVGVELDNASFGLALMSAGDGTIYYALNTTVGGLRAVGLPDGFTMSATNLGVQINSSTNGSSVVNFDQSFVHGTGLAIAVGGTTIDLDYQQQFFEASGTIDLAFKGFVDIQGSMAIEYMGSQSVTVTGSSTPVTVSTLTIGASAVTIFAGDNGPASNSGAVGVELQNAGFALALMKAANGTTYFGLMASADSLSAVGLPANTLQISGTSLNLEINGSSGGTGGVVNYDASFPGASGNGLSVPTGPSSSQVLDFTQEIVQLQGALSLGVAGYIQVSGGFSFTQTSGGVDIVVGSAAFASAPVLAFTVGTASNPIFSATGSLSISITPTTFTINNASLTVSASTPLKIASVLQVVSPSVTLSNLSINLASGNMTGTVGANGAQDPVLTVTAESASLFPDSTSFSGSVTPTSPGGLGFQGTFDLATGTFSITLQQFKLVVGSVFTATSSNVLVTYNPSLPDSQQIVQIGSGTLDFKVGSSDIIGSLTNLTIYGDGFHFDSVTISYSGSVSLGSLLTLTGPSVTLTDFGVTFASGGGVTEGGSLTVGVSSASLAIGSFTANVTTLSVTIGLSPATLGNLSITAGKVDFKFSTYLDISATNISINSDPGNGGAYFSVGTASATVTITSSFTIGGSASNFSVIDNNGAPEFHAGANFSVSLTPPSPFQLGLPNWLGFSITQFSISWPDFTANPTNFQITLSAGISSIQGVPSTVSVSGYVNDVIINVGELGSWLQNPSTSNFPISFGPDGGIGGSLSGTLFGLDFSAAFVGGIVTFNREGDIINGTTITGPSSGLNDSVVYGSGFYIGVSGSASIPGVGAVTASLGFSNLGPLAFYLSYTGAEGLILDPDSGLEINSFSAGVAFDTSMETPATATDLPGVLANAMTAISGSATGSGNVDASQWATQLELATAAQFISSNGGTNPAGAYTQPFLIEGSVGLSDAYAPDSIAIQGQMVLCINPSATGNQAPVSILVVGTVTLGGATGLSAGQGYLYASISAASAQLMFLVDMPASVPIEEFGGGLTFSFLTANGQPASLSNLPTGCTLDLNGFFEYSAAGLASISVTGNLTLTITASQTTIDFSADINVSFLGDLGDASGELVLLYPGSTYAGSSATATTTATASFTNNSGNLEIYGALDLYTGSALAALQNYGLVINGATLFQINTTGQTVTVNLPPTPLQPAGSPSTPFNVLGNVYFEMTVSGTSSANATISYEVDNQTLFQMEGFFDLRVINDPTNGLEMELFANIQTLTLGPPGTQFLSFSGFGLILIDSQGLSAEMNLTLGSGNAIPELSFNANFDLVMNTTSQAVSFTVPTVTVPGSASGTMTTSGITIYNSDGSTSTVTSLVIPAGPPQGALQDINGAGAYTTVGATGPYFVVTGSGGLTILPDYSAFKLDLSGYFYFQMSYSASTGPVVELVLKVNGTVGSLGQASVTGDFQLSEAGMVALLDVSVSGGGSGGNTTDYGSGVTLDITAELGINTTNEDINQIGADPTNNPVLQPGNVFLTQTTTSGGTTTTSNITLNADSFQIVASGTLTMNIGGSGFVISGVFGISTNGNQTTITASGTLKATVDNDALLTMDASGVLIYTSGSGAGSGIAGELTLTLTGADPLSGNGFSYHGAYDLELNTTLASQTATVYSSTGVPSTVTISAGANGNSAPAAYAEVHANGTIIFGSSTDGFELAGDFFLAAGSDGLDVSLNAALSVVIGSQTLLSATASGGMLISSTGFAASLTATATLTDHQYYAFGGAFTLNVNMTGTTQTVGTDITVPAAANGGSPGPYIELAVSGTLALGTTTTNSSTGTGIYLTANNFDITISSGGLAISVSSATLKLVVAGSPFFTLNATGAILISNQGMAARVSVTGSSIPQDSVFAFHVSLLLEVNTTGLLVPSINGQTVNLPARDAFGNYFYVDLAGSGMLTLAGFVNINGSFTFAAGSAGVNLEANGTVLIMGVVFTINADAGIYSDGIAINATLGVSGGGSAASFLSGVVTISANFQLQINNTGQSHFGVAPGTAFVLSIYGPGGPGSFADVYVFGFDFQGSLSIKVNTSGVFVAQGQLAFNFFNFATLTVAFYFNSSGQYYFYGGIYLQLGSNSFNIHGSLTMAIANISATFSYTDANNHTSTVSVSPGFLMAVNGGVTAFGFTFASVGASVEINGSSVSISAYVSVNFGLFSIGGTVTIHLGSLANVPTPPPPAVAQTLSGSTTIDGESFGSGTLVLNIGSYATGRGVAAQASENYTITPVPGQPGDVYVDAPGIYGQPIEYQGVSEIVVPEADTSNVNVQIDPGVTIPVVIFAGSGTNQFITGGGQATIHGTSGNDTVIGGSGGVIFHAGSGTSQFLGGTGNNTIYDPGAVSVAEGYTSATYDSTTDTTNPDPIYYSYYNLTGSTLTYGNGTTNYTDTLVGSFSSITLTAPPSGATTFQVSNYAGNLTLNANGNSSVTTSIELDAGNMSLTGNTVTESNGPSGIITLQGINSVSLLGGSGNNAFTVNSWSGTGAVNLNGACGSDTYTINFQSGGSLTANVGDTGTSGTDTVVVNGPVGNGAINVNGGSVSFGSQLVNYSGIENLIVYTNTGNDTVNINGTTAATTVNAGSGNDTVNVTGITDPTTINLGSGTNTVNVGTLAPTETGGLLNSIQAQLTINGGNGGTDTLNLDDSGDNSTSTATLTTTSLTGVFGAGGSLDYSSIASLSLYLGNGAHTVNVQGMDGTVNISLGTGANTLNIGSNAGPIVTNASTGDAANTGSVLTQITGILNFNGGGANTFNVDDSGSNVAVQAALKPTSMLFLNLVSINFTNAVAMNFSLSQSGDVFAVQDTFSSASVSPVIVVDGNGGGDTFVVIDSHAVMTLNGGDGGDSFYVLGNSSVLNLNGDAGNDDFYIYASVEENTSNVSTGSGNSQVYSYRVNAAVNIDGGSGDNTVYIFGTSLNDTFTINGTQVSGAGIDVNYTNIQQLVVEGLGGNNTFYIEAVTIPTTVIGNGNIVPVPSLAALGITLPNLNGDAPPATSFNDTFYVGWQGASYLPGSLAGFTAPLTICGYNGPDMNGATVYPAGTIDTIYVNDSGDTANESFTLTPNLLTSTAMGAGGEMFYDTAVSNFNLAAGSGNNTFVVSGTGANAGTSIYGGSGLGAFIVNAANGGSLASPLGIFGGSITYPGDTLTVNGAGDGNTFDITGTSVNGAGAIITYQSIAQLTVNAGGPTTFNVNGDLVPTYLNGDNSGDAFNVNNSVAPLYISAGAGNDTFLVNGNSSALAITDSGGVNGLTVTGNGGSLGFVGGGGGDTIVIDGNSGMLTVSEPAGGNSFTVNGNGGILMLNGGSGDDLFIVNALGAPATLNGGAGNDTFTVNGPLAASLTVNGGGAVGDVLTINGTAGNDTVTIRPTVVRGLGAPINYTGTNLVLNGVAGNDTFYIVNTSLATTTINGGIDGNDTFNIQATTGTLNLNGGAGANTFNLGSLAPATGGTLGQLAGAINIAGGTGVSTINVDDTGDAALNTGLLTANTLTGLGLGAGVTYTGVSVLNINFGSGNDTFNVQGTSAATVTTLNTGAGADIVNLGSLAPVAGGVLSGFEGALVIVGGGNDALNVDDTGDAARNSGVLTANTLTGLGMGGRVTYSGVAVLKINLGSGSDTLNVQSTAAATATTLNTGVGVDTVNVGSAAPASGGLTSGIQGELIIVGGGNDTLNVDDTGDAANMSGTLSATTLTGLGIGLGGITYSGLSALNVSIGSGKVTLLIESTSSAVTTLNSGSGNDTFNIQATTGTLNVNGGAGASTFNLGSLAPATGGTLGQLAGAVNIAGGTGVSTINVADTGDLAVNTGVLNGNTLTGLGMGAGLTYARISVLNINLGSGADTFNVRGTAAATVTTLNTGAGADIVNLGTLAPVAGGVLSGIEGALLIVGGGNDALIVDDTGDAVRNTGTLTASTLTGLAMGGSATYSGVAELKINLGSGGDTFYVQSTAAATVTTLNTGVGADTVNVWTSGGSIKGALVVVGGGNDTLNVYDLGDTANMSATLGATTLTGLGMSPGGIAYSGLSVLNISLDDFGNTFTVTGVANATATTITGGSGTNTAVLNFSGNFAGTNLTLVNFATATLNVGGDFSGSLTDAGAITPVSIGGTLTSTGVLTAGSISTMTVGGNMAGLITVNGLLGTLAVTGGTLGKIVAGDIHLITVQAGSGNVLLNVVENGVEREILATPVSGATMPAAVQFAFVYDSETSATPEVAIRISDSSPVARSFNLALVVVNSTALFNLSLVDSNLNASTGISNISVQGSLLTRLTSPEWQFFPGLKAASRAGVVLPASSITGVEVSGTLPIGFIDVHGIEGLAFARLTTASGTPVSVTSPLASQVLWNLLGSRAAINSATDAFVIPFGLTAVRLFARDGIGAVLSQVMTFADQLHDNSTVTAYVQLAPSNQSGVNPLAQSITLAGDGGSINSVLSIANLTSTGPLGNVTITASAGKTVNNAAGLGNMTAPDIFGNIDVTQAGIYGVIQTTNGDIGQTTAKGVTSIISGAFTGEIISAGNLVSSVTIHGAFSGVIAAQGDIGAIKRNSSGSALTTSSGALTRYGGVAINGRDSGQIIALGNILGNITVTATMTGRIAAQGQAVAGLDASRIGILGNVTIHSCAAGTAIISGGIVGDGAGKTSIKLGKAGGFVAAQGNVNMKSTTMGAGNMLENVTGANLSAIKAIFTNGGVPLQFNTGGNLQGLALIGNDLKNLENSAGSLSGPIL